jgi:hypothetical protein
MKGREADPIVFVYAASGYHHPGKDNGALRAECADTSIAATPSSR